MNPFLAFVCAFGLSTTAVAQTPPVDPEREARSEAIALDAAAADLCGRRVALLGENGFHGDGRTSAFKARLVRRLVETCGFDAVYFESGRYDFIPISAAVRDGRPVSRVELAAAIGQLWNQNEEIQPLIDWLHEQVSAHRLAIGGLDDQLGSRGMTWSLEALSGELAALVPEGRRDACQRRFRQRIWSAYSASDPYTPDVRAELRDCLDLVGSGVADLTDSGRRADLAAVVRNFTRLVERDEREPALRLEGRDESMFLNLLDLMADTGPQARIIVWTANAHAARTPDPSGPFSGLRTFGSRVHDRFGDEAFALGFTAAAGEFRYTVRTSNPIDPAPAHALESLAFAGASEGSEAVYAPGAILAGLGRVSGAAFDDHKQTPAVWSDHYDGIVVFARERPPIRLDEPAR